MSDSSLPTSPANSVNTEGKPADAFSNDLMRVMTDLQGAMNAAALDRVMIELTQLQAADPSNGMVLMGLGIGHARRQAWPLAQDCFERAVAAAPKLAPARMNLGNLHRQQGRSEQARAAYEKAIELQPGLPDAHYNLSLLQDEAGESAEAEASVRRALLFKSDYPEAHNNLGHLLIKAGKVEQALSHFRQALVWAPDLLPARFNLILALYRLGRSHEAQVEIDQVLALHPDNVQVLRVQAVGLMQMGQLDDAEQVNRKLLELQPDAPDLRLNQADALLMREDFDGAKTIYQDLLGKRLVPPAVGIGAMGNLMRAQSQFTEARTLYQQALMMDNRLPALVLGLARTLTEAGELKQGLASWQRAVEMLPRAAEVHSGLIMAQRLDPDTESTQQAQEITRWIHTHGQPAGNADTPLRPQFRQADEQLRLGFLIGADTPGVTLTSLQALQKSAHKKMPLFFYQSGVANIATQALQQGAEHWRPVNSLGLTDLAEQIRQDAVDVLIDTVGHGLGSRLPVLAQRAAPLQVGWLGDFTPLGMPGVDSVLSDRVVAHGCESGVTYVDPLYHWQAPVNAPAISAMATKADIIFGMVSPLSHLNAKVLDAWAEILRANPTSELHVLSRLSPADTATRQRLTRLLLIRDIALERVHFDIAYDEDTRLQNLGNVTAVLDTFPMPMSMASTLECLWMGVPVLTLAGFKPWTRTSASVLSHAGLDDWITDTPESYIARASRLVESAPSIEKWRHTARERLQSSSIMNSAHFVQAFESAIEGLWVEAASRNITSAG